VEESDVSKVWLNFALSSV